MGWRPRLIVRFGKGGSIASPSSTLGYVLAGLLALALTAVLVAAAYEGRPLMLVALFAPGLWLRDCCAWFAATEAERSEFRANLARLGGGRDRPPAKPILVGVRWGVATFALLLTGLAGTLMLVAYGHPTFLVPAMFLLALLAVGALDKVRGWMRRRH